MGKTVGLYGQKVSAAERKRVFALLRKSGINAGLNGQAEIELRKMGVVKTRKAPLTLYVYVATFPPVYPGGAMHQESRLLVLTDTEYLGSYTITEFPLRLKGNVLEFPRDKRFLNEDLGYKIVFGPEGPPKEIYLLGETHRFSK
jgi:hypothetical protein